ncbi:MAG: hypothetical protein KKG09_02975 [Verrucomicrobia bacterium]|nr:hypothetical protein [Verrucomicrobiota bacterium]MCG2681930.1 hypothetical protein [Kiritimatiellia bacterium]MBU4247130.1 hypothetical protein [Verrucomicrobiota bacterium]MBU4290971.1 hypothetical protein [Verrucomicrobiota bacterium]MBU4430434.1 hypothetical protein [Verrucomicrobiota bacterium]
MKRLFAIIVVGWILGVLALSRAETNTRESPWHSTLASPAEPGAAVNPAGAFGGIDWAPLVSRDVDVNGDARVRMLGPLYEGRKAADGKSLWAVHPLVSTLQDPSDQRQERDILWPLLVSKRHRDFWQWRLAGFGLWRDYDITDPDSRYSMWFIPFYFQGRDADRNPYLAVFPVGGKISNILMWDEVWFALFPLYGYGRIKDIETYTYLWPLLATSHGKDVPVRRAFIFPLYGYSLRENAFDKRFLLWPFWTSARYFYPKSHGYGWILFPVVGHIKLSDQESWMFLPPFSRFSRGTQLTQVNCPWPIFQYCSGSIDKLYFWPVVGYKVIGDTQTGFLFWPIGITSRRVMAEGVNQRYFMLPIVYSETLTRRNPAGSVLAETVDFRAFKVWPLFTYRRQGNRSRFGFPSLCPAKDFAVIERNYAPLWTLYSHSVSGDVKEDELLWGLFQYRRSSAGMLKTSLFPLFSIEREKSGDGVEWSFLKGLIGSERDGDRKRTRLLYLFRW